MELSLADEVGDRSNRRSESSSYSCLPVKGNALLATGAWHRNASLSNYHLELALS